MYYDINIIQQNPFRIFEAFLVIDVHVELVADVVDDLFRNGVHLRLRLGMTDDEIVGDCRL